MTFSDFLQGIFCLGGEVEEIVEFLADVIIAISAVLDFSVDPAFSNFADCRIAEEASSFGCASVAVDIRGLDVGFVFLPPHCGDLLPLFVAVLLGGDVRETFSTYKSAHCNDISHFKTPLLNLWIQTFKNKLALSIKLDRDYILQFEKNQMLLFHCDCINIAKSFS